MGLFFRCISGDNGSKANVINQYFNYFIFSINILINIKCLSINRMVKLYGKLDTLTSVLEFFTTREFKISNKNVIMLLGRLEDVEKEEFNFDIQQLDCQTYWVHYVLGIRNYIMKEEDFKLPKSRNRLKRINFLSKFFFFLVLYGFAYISTKFNFIPDFIISRIGFDIRNIKS
jgi:hypothetical protein